MVPLLHCGGWLARRRLRLLKAILFSLLLSSLISAQSNDDKDPVFSTVPFDRWVAQGDHVDIPWKVKISPPQLSEQQRFLVTVTITVDGKHLAKRPPGGELLMLVQIEDSQGRVYQGHASVALTDMNKDVRRADFVYTHSALVIPGDYRLTLAMLHRSDLNRNQGDHNLGHGVLHVAPLKNDPLPDLWTGAPPVEIIGKESEMEEWFHPDLTGRLYLPVETRRPVRIELLVNLPKSRSAGEYYRQCMGGLLAQMKVLSQMELGNGTMNITLLDVQHHRAVALSRRGGSLDWSELQAALEQANPNVIDVRNLGTTREEAEFLAAEARGKLAENPGGSDERRSEPLPILIVLSVPAMLGGEVSGTPVSSAEIHEHNVYLLRYHPPITRKLARPPAMGPININDAAIPDYDISGGRAAAAMGGPPRMRQGPAPMPQGPFAAEKAISLQEVLKSLKPRIFDLQSPLQFREALAAILEEISRI